jgi:hypothetical protein
MVVVGSPESGAPVRVIETSVIGVVAEADEIARVVRPVARRKTALESAADFLSMKILNPGKRDNSTQMCVTAKG